MRLIALALPFVSCLLSAQIPIPSTGSVRLVGGQKTQFVDFSEALDRAQTTVLVGTLGKFRDGKKKRVDTPKSHSGGIGNVIRISGTQYFEAKSRTKLRVESCVAGRILKGKVALSFKVRLNRMSDGSMQRMVLGAERHALKAGMRALFVIDREPKSKAYQIVHVIPMKDGQKQADFDKDLADFVAVNRQLAELRRVYSEAKAAPTVDAKKTKAKIEAVLKTEIEFKKMANESLELSVLRPWQARLKKLIQS